MHFWDNGKTLERIFPRKGSITAGNKSENSLCKTISFSTTAWLQRTSFHIMFSHYTKVAVNVTNYVMCPFIIWVMTKRLPSLSCVEASPTTLRNNTEWIYANFVWLQMNAKFTQFQYCSSNIDIEDARLHVALNVLLQHPKLSPIRIHVWAWLRWWSCYSWPRPSVAIPPTSTLPLPHPTPIPFHHVKTQYTVPPSMVMYWWMYFHLDMMQGFLKKLVCNPQFCC